MKLLPIIVASAFLESAPVASAQTANTTALLVQGQPAQPSGFGDGRLCVGGSLVRVAAHAV